jgi:hypothetical protein
VTWQDGEMSREPTRHAARNARGEVLSHNTESERNGMDRSVTSAFTSNTSGDEIDIDPTRSHRSARRSVDSPDSRRVGRNGYDEDDRNGDGRNNKRQPLLNSNSSSTPLGSTSSISAKAGGLNDNEFDHVGLEQRPGTGDGRGVPAPNADLLKRLKRLAVSSSGAGIVPMNQATTNQSHKILVAGLQVSTSSHTLSAVMSQGTILFCSLCDRSCSMHVYASLSCLMGERKQDDTTQ